MWKVEGDGSYQHTFIWKDGKRTSYTKCVFRIDEKNCFAIVDGIKGKLDRLILSAIYLTVSDGGFENSRIIFCDEQLRGVQRVIGKIEKGKPPLITIHAILLPNIIENAPPPRKVDKRLVTYAEEARKK
jgi:hypothetical protein